MKKENLKYYPDIEEYQYKLGHGYQVSTYGLENISEEIVAKTTLNKDQAEIIIKTFFQEIRNIVLEGNLVNIKNLGKFLLSSPKTTKNKTQVRLKYKCSKSLIKKINGK